MPDVVAIVLAAGQGSRLGGPKALLAAARGGLEMPLIEAQCRDRLAAESSRALAVLRPDVADVAGDRLRAAGADVVVSRAPEELGPAGSIAAAAAHLETRGAGAPFALVVTPVDVRVEPATVAALVAALAEGAALAAVPRCGARRGHPVVLRPEALDRYREADPPPLRDHLRALGERVLTVDVTDAGVLEDLDHPHQTGLHERLTGLEAPPRFFGGIRT